MACRSPDPLTPREHQVMAWVMRGETDAQVAQRLELSPRTVTNYVHAACQKLCARNRTVAAVQYYLRYALSEQGASQQSEVEPLTPQEQRVMQFVACGQTNQEIAELLDLSELTVKQHFAAIRRKLNVPNRVAAAVAYYRRLGL